jgi:hypothetical protein
VVPTTLPLEVEPTPVPVLVDTTPLVLTTPLEVVPVITVPVPLPMPLSRRKTAGASTASPASVPSKARKGPPEGRSATLPQPTITSNTATVEIPVRIVFSPRKTANDLDNVFA